MSRTFGSIVLILFGVGMLAAAWRGYVAGVLPAGAAGSQAYRPNRSDNPVAFRGFLSLYFCAGFVLVVWGILALLGAAPALQIR